MRTTATATCAALLLAAPAAATPFMLLTGLDVGRYPGTDRTVTAVPGGGTPGTFRDGDRLAGTADTGNVIVFQGAGTPLLPPNHVGALSFQFRRGSVPFAGITPLMGIDFLGGRLLDLDGDPAPPRRLVPVAGQTAVEIGGSFSRIDLAVNLAGALIRIENFDATGSNEGSPGFQAELATTLTTIAGTNADGSAGPRLNPAWDTRVGALTALTGTGGTLTGVYRITGLRVELWYDSIDPASSTADVLGTFQYFADFRGWLVLRDCGSGLFPTLAGQGLGSTIWPLVDTSQVGQTFNTAHGLAGGTATITDGVPGDQYSASSNGGVAMSDFSGDLGAYFDARVVPLLAPDSAAFVYLESAGFGINNSGDPVFTDTVGYDVVVLAAAAAPLFEAGDVNGDGAVNYLDGGALAAALVNPTAPAPCDASRADVNADGSLDGRDIRAFLDVLP